ncbi:MAG: malate dehydrogenase [Planctomycetota bacterium]
MGRNKVTIVGAGNVGATAAHAAACRNLGDIVLIDIVENLAAGKALDIAEAANVQGYDTAITGTTDWQQTADSDIVIVTSGLRRKPGMSRDDLLAKNVEITKQVSEKIAQLSPDSFVIVVSNPLDAMVYTASKCTGFAKNKVLGMAGALDCARFACFIAQELDVCVEDIRVVLMGGHGDGMVPLPRFTSVCGIPVTELIDDEKLAALIDRTRNGGIEVVNLLGYSAYYAPGAGAVKMAEAILKDRKMIICCCVYCQSEYNVGGYYVGVPCIVGKDGAKAIELSLNQAESELFEQSLSHVKQLVSKVDSLL